MTQDLESIFGELGLTQYLDAFLDQGFDAWDTILDIQESDLDALGVKLGHRRKLQRRIANARGIAPGVSLPSPVRQPSEERKQEGSARPEAPRPEPNHDTSGVAKRKYRRHPKPDENAPERPPSAYVLFSNKMREDLKSQNLTFTEIAKLVGEHWQNLDPAEKEVYESQANAAKDKYHRDLAEYKKTPDYRKYAHYLQEFKERQAKQHQAHDSTKRAKLEPGRLRHGSSSSSNTTPAGSMSTASVSGSEKVSGEPSQSRQRRGNSIASLAESHHSSTAPTPLSHRNSLDEPGPSPRTVHGDSSSHHRDHSKGHVRQHSAWRDYGRPEQGATHLPSLSDMLDDNSRGMVGPATIDNHAYSTGGFVAANQRRRVPDGPSARRTVPAPLLHHEPSSSGSNGSGTSSFSRGSGEGSLPIHALLSGRSISSATPTTYETSPASSIGGSGSPVEKVKPALGYSGGPRGYGFQAASSAFQHMKTEVSGDGDVVMTSDDQPSASDALGGKAQFGGMDALLRAGEIVGRHDRA